MQGGQHTAGTSGVATQIKTTGVEGAVIDNIV